MKSDIKEKRIRSVEKTKNNSVFVIYRVSPVSLKYAMKFMGFEAGIKSVCHKNVFPFTGFFLDAAWQFPE